MQHQIYQPYNPILPMGGMGGPDEILLCNGKGLYISHTGHTQINTPHCALSLSNVLCAPCLCNNLISIAKLCKSNQVSMEFFSHLIFCEGSLH